MFSVSIVCYNKIQNIGCGYGLVALALAGGFSFLQGHKMWFFWIRHFAIKFVFEIIKDHQLLQVVKKSLDWRNGYWMVLSRIKTRSFLDVYHLICFTQRSIRLCLICVTLIYYLYGSTGGLCVRTVLMFIVQMEDCGLGIAWKIWHCIDAVKHIESHI